jgi:hypothetical protein
LAWTGSTKVCKEREREEERVTKKCAEKEEEKHTRRIGVQSVNFGAGQSPRIEPEVVQPALRVFQ